MASLTSLYQSSMIEVNGKRMTLAEYRKSINSKKKAKRQKKMLTEIQLLPTEITSLLKGVKVLKSLVAFYNNGYKQWGRIHRELLAVDDMNTKFAIANIAINDVNRTINTIIELSNKKEKSVYQYVQKLAYKMAETKDSVAHLYNVVRGSHIINSPFAKHEIISGEGRRLGLRILMRRTFDALKEIDPIVERLNKLGEIPDDVYNNCKLMGYGTK